MIGFRARAFIEALAAAEELQAALGGRGRYQRKGAPKGYRNGHRERRLVGTFGAVTLLLPRSRLFDEGGREKEWKSQTIQAYKRLSAGRSVRGPGLFGGKVGKDAVSRAWRKAQTDWQARQAQVRSAAKAPSAESGPTHLKIKGLFSPHHALPGDPSSAP